MAAYFPSLQKYQNGLQSLFSYYKQILIPFLFQLVFTPSFAQYDKDDSIPSFLQSVYQQYMSSVGGSANLYNGAEYEGSYRNILGSPFWKNNGFQNGSIVYEGIVYNDVPIAFDLVRNEVLTKSFQQIPIRLETAQLNAFLLNGHTFVTILNDTTRFNPLPDDIYDLLFNSTPIKVFAKRTKNIRSPLHAENQDTILSHAYYYVRYHNTNYPVRDTKDLTRIFHGAKNQLTAFWKDHHLSFKKDPEPFIIQTASFWLQQKK